MTHNIQVSQSTAKTIRLNRIKLLGLFAIVFVPMVAATSMYFGGWGIPTGSTNNGELIWPPVNIAELLDFYTSLDTNYPDYQCIMQAYAKDHLDWEIQVKRITEKL